jgi:heterodisulfide reductase subunit A
MQANKQITVEINGKKIQVPQGTSILKAAGKLDIKIPTLCYHNSLSAYGACRVCLVEVEQNGRTELKTSCNNLAQEGMAIKTDSQRVLKARKVIVELLLARNPEAEPILEIAKQLSIKQTRFPQKEEKCILCGLCVRMCQERMGKGAISFANKGIRRVVVPAFERQSEVCQVCGACESICPSGCMDVTMTTSHKPVPIASEYNAGLSSRHPISILSAQSVPKVAVIDKEHCVHLQNGTCQICKDACEAGAINFEQKERDVTIDVGSVILTPGFNEFEAQSKGEYGFGRYQNVVTSVQFERILSAAGPFQGHVLRLSDGREAKNIAWIQCVGSRDSKCGNDYCSSICCMASTKQAMVASEHVDGLDATIFYMDIRAHGKDFDLYYERAKTQKNIHYIKSIPSRVIQMPHTNDVRVKYVDEGGQLKEQEFDLIVLMVGMEPSASIVEHASAIGLELNSFGFCQTDRFLPLNTSREGVFVGGAFQEPKDIPETVTQASGAASMAMELLASERNTLITKKSYPEEHDVTDEQPRIGVFICHCGINIASVVDVEQVTENVKDEDNVIFATHTMFTCSDTSLSDIKEMIHKYRLNRVVVASCTPRTHEPLFRETLREAGLNPYLFEMANIRDQCSWVHSNVPQSATEKATELVKMAISRARYLSPLEGSTLAVDQKGLVIGGGLSGMTAALALADQGFKVHLVEHSDHLGGNLHDIYYTLEKDDVSAMTKELISRVENHPEIDVYLGTEIGDISGHIGKFNAKLTKDGQRAEVTSGAVIVATGAEQAQTTEYLYGKSENVMTQIELEKQLHEGTFSAKEQNIVMIQCVGSRDEERPYCSRICCTMAVKNALAIKKKDPDANIFVLYRDVRTYGFREIYYKEAREAGIVFIRYVPESKPQVIDKNGLLVSLKSPDFPEPIEIEADRVVLSTGVATPIENNKRISNILKVPLNTSGFYVEAHMKLRPVDFATEGVYLCGLAHSPKFIDENISQARAAAARAATVLSKTHLDVSAQVSYVDQSKCISCMTCVKTCPYTAPFCNKDGKAQIEAAKCMGCGLCAAECPARAIQLNHFETDQFSVMIKTLFEKENDKQVTKIPVEAGLVP